jgi:hypothetical protein
MVEFQEYSILIKEIQRRGRAEDDSSVLWPEIVAPPAAATDAPG